MTQERISLLKAYGSEVVLTPGDEKMPGAIRKAQELANNIPNSFIPMQFENNANPDAHRHTTAVEIREAVEEINLPFTAFIAPAGTGGTITGTGESLKKWFPDLTVHVVEPAGSPVLSGGKPGKHKLVGTSPGFVPPILNTSVYDEILRVEDDDAYNITRRLAAEEGILVGPSSGASVFGALKVAATRKKGEVVICITCDSGERYLSSDLFQF
jgi:cysteine synthase A